MTSSNLPYSHKVPQVKRLGSFYRIIDKESQSIPFHMNPIQLETLEGLHNRNIILKARQVGMSTFAVLYLLDMALNNPNLSCGIVSYSIEHAQHIFKKIIGHALENLHEANRPVVKSKSAREIVFGHGSSIRVDTTLRGGSYPLVLVSEFGKICARNPLKAEEVITGTLQSVPKTGQVIIESTGEGSEGYFAEMVLSAQRDEGKDLSPLEYKLFFYPWYKDQDYTIDACERFDAELDKYFSGLEKEGIVLTSGQKNWYGYQHKMLGAKVKQEFPTTISEAFLSSSDAFYFAECISDAYGDNRCLDHSPYDPLLPVFVAMDIGVNDLTCIVFFQLCHGEIRIIDFYADKNKGLDFYAHHLLQNKNYLYNTIFLPHDSVKRDPFDMENSYEREMKKLFRGLATRFVVLPRMDKQMQIAKAKNAFRRCVFAISKTKELLDNVAKYRKKWSEAYGKYLEDPLHNEASNYADAFMYAVQGASHSSAADHYAGRMNAHKEAVANRHKRII